MFSRFMVIASPFDGGACLPTSIKGLTILRLGAGEQGDFPVAASRWTKGGYEEQRWIALRGFSDRPGHGLLRRQGVADRVEQRLVSGSFGGVGRVRGR
jgi:hypothetical protein